LINKILMVIGKINILANVTKRPVTNEIPQSNSIVFAKGNKYVEATNPILKALKLPVVSGSGASLKKKLIEAKSSNRPIKTRTIMVAIFIILDLIG